MLCEKVILVDKNDNQLGLMEKIEAHEKAILHRAFSVFILNENNELLLQKRGINKYHSPGLWTNTCCSHPRNGEDVIDAGIRRLKEEMGFVTKLSSLLSFIYKADENNTFRSTFTSAIRNPTLLNQYMYYNVGRAILIGNINGYDSLVTIESLRNFAYSQKPDTLNYFNLESIQPEKVKSIEIGYRGTIKNKIYIDGSYYYSWYKDFIGYINGVDMEVSAINTPLVRNVYRIATNSKQRISTQGFSIGINYYLDKSFAVNGNYSWNRLNQKSDDPIIPAYNTPEHKFNIGFSGQNIEISSLKLSGLGFNINYKWIEGFIFEGSPQFTGEVPTYSLLDLQINKLE